MTSRTTVQCTSDREVTVTRTFDAAAPRVYAAWTQPELFQKWWLPRSMGMKLLSCEMDARTGGKYRLVFEGGMAFFGTYLEVIPDSRLVWSNEEGGDSASITTVSFEDQAGRTALVLREVYPTKQALETVGTGPQEMMQETFMQLDELLGG